MTNIRANKVSFDIKPELSRVFVGGFYTWLRHFHKDKDKLVEAFQHIFDLQYFYVALDGGEVAAMVACTQGYAPIALQRREFTGVLGFLRGNIAYHMLKRHMVRNAYPFKLGRSTGSIEFVATAPEHRNKGIAHDLILYVMGQNPYDSYVLEVADTNAGAVHLYQKLGFREIKRVKAPNPKRSGVNNFLYMRRDMNGD
ncbi:MAG: GNAT family N-acetyltransferase [Defluviitaleaceae bacterium]|nr:GNAT family N-acetyltransferase [Defluviitaleaceae bacterium]